MDTESPFSPPYNIAWATFLSTAERIAEDPPTRVDRSYLDSQSGTIQTYLIAAYKGFGLIDADSRPTGILGWVDPDVRKRKVADLMRTYYSTIVPLGTTNSTTGELSDAFASAFPQITGESRVKAIRFFLSAMTYAELPRAPLWGQVKAPRGASGKKAPRKPKPSGDTSPSVTTLPPATSEAAMRAEYFRLLIEKAKSADDADLLDRIERLVGVETTPNGSGKRRKTSVTATGSTTTPTTTTEVGATD